MSTTNSTTGEKPIPAKTGGIPGITPALTLRDAMRWRGHLAEAIAELIKDYERNVPHVKIESIQISRTETKLRFGGTRNEIVVTPRVVVAER